MNGVNTKLATTIDRLDTIIQALGLNGDMLTEIQDIHLDTQSMDSKLLTIRDDLADVHLDTQSMDSKLLTVRDTLADIYTQVLNLAPGTFDWESVIGTSTGSTDNILAWLAQTISSLGIPTGDATTTVLGRLSAIETLNYNYLPLIATNTGKCPCGASPPPDGNICEEPYISTGMAFVPIGIIEGFSSVTIAVWGTTPPPQLEYGTVFGTVADNSSLVPKSGQNWVGRSIFVETGAENFGLQTLDTARYPTNTWVDLSAQGTAEISVIVDPGASVRAYICPDNGGGGGGSWGGGGGGGTWGGGCDNVTSDNIITNGAGTFYVIGPVDPYAPNPTTFNNGDYNGYTITLLSANRIDAVFVSIYGLGGGYANLAQLDATGESITISVPTLAIGFFSVTAHSDGAFEVEICPPE